VSTGCFFRYSGPKISESRETRRFRYRHPAWHQYLRHVYYQTDIGDERVRVASLSVPHKHGRILVQVAETFIKRERLVRKLLFSTLIPELFVVLAAIALFWYGIQRGLRPLERLREEIASRSAATGSRRGQAAGNQAAGKRPQPATD
jgi:hypothetical protein